ncbi:MAG: helix-turn-helix transcriptional regulator [Leptolyngbyaceae cyanobacterium RU_5_1]|nr:helix-turn-helix transcriptional regulator [Leptolyngbyaceae cyanobacterium RU_5_1]
MKSSRRAVSKPAFVLVQPEISCLLRELRQLTQLTQVQLAAALGVAYETINRWENRRIQPSPLALMQIRMLVTELSQSSSAVVREGSKQLLAQYFSDEERPCDG